MSKPVFGLIPIAVMIVACRSSIDTDSPQQPKTLVRRLAINISTLHAAAEHHNAGSAGEMAMQAVMLHLLHRFDIFPDA